MPPDKLPLVRTAMRMLADVLTERDRVAIVVYAGASGLVLPSTTGEHKERIHQALAQLEAGGSTNGAAGIRLAYQVARAATSSRRRQSRDPRHRWRLQRRRHQSERARQPDRTRARERHLPVGARRRHRQPEGLDDGEAGGQGQRQLLPTSIRCTKRGRCSCARRARRSTTIAKDVKIQVEFNPRAVVGLSADRLREPAAEERGLQRRQEGCGRDRRRPFRHGAL